MFRERRNTLIETYFCESSAFFEDHKTTDDRMWRCSLIELENKITELKNKIELKIYSFLQEILEIIKFAGTNSNLPNFVFLNANIYYKNAPIRTFKHIVSIELILLRVRSHYSGSHLTATRLLENKYPKKNMLFLSLMKFIFRMPTFV